MKYKKKPVVIEAIKWDGLNLYEIHEFLGDDYHGIVEIYDAAWQAGAGAPIVTITIPTNEGNMICDVGDYIIKEPFPTNDRKYYPCKPDIFDQTYEPVSD